MPPSPQTADIVLITERVPLFLVPPAGAATVKMLSGMSVVSRIGGRGEVKRPIIRSLYTYVSGELEKEEYHAKRSELVAGKMDLKAKMEGLGRNLTERLEPLIDFVNWSKGLNKAVVSYDVRALASALKKSSSNRRITARKILLTVEPPYSFLAEGRATGNFSG